MGAPLLRPLRCPAGEEFTGNRHSLSAWSAPRPPTQDTHDIAGSNRLLRLRSFIGRPGERHPFQPVQSCKCRLELLRLGLPVKCDIHQHPDQRLAAFRLAFTTCRPLGFSENWGRLP